MQYDVGSSRRDANDLVDDVQWRGCCEEELSDMEKMSYENVRDVFFMQNASALMWTVYAVL